MIQGTLNGSKRDVCFFSQSNNSTEAIIDAIKTEIRGLLLTWFSQQGMADRSEAAFKFAKLYGILESCGGSTMASVSYAVKDFGAIIDQGSITKYLEMPGTWAEQWDDAAMMCANDPRNAALFDPVIGKHGSVMENRYASIHYLIIKLMFGLDAEPARVMDFDDVAQRIWTGDGADILIPGHYVGGVLVNDTAGVILINDSWRGRPLFGGGIRPASDDGFNRILTREEFNSGSRLVTIVKKVE
jgi:hypothetical protein